MLDASKHGPPEEGSRGGGRVRAAEVLPSAVAELSIGLMMSRFGSAETIPTPLPNFTTVSHYATHCTPPDCSIIGKSYTVAALAPSLPARSPTRRAPRLPSQDGSHLDTSMAGSPTSRITIRFPRHTTSFGKISACAMHRLCRITILSPMSLAAYRTPNTSHLLHIATKSEREGPESPP